MAGGYFILSNRNLKRITYDNSESDYNNYKFMGVPYKATVDYNTEEITGKESLLQTFSKVIIIDSGKYRATDGVTYDERDLDFPARLNFAGEEDLQFSFVSEKFRTTENDTDYENYIIAIFTPFPSYEQATDDLYVFRGVEWKVTLHFEKQEVTE